MQSGRRGRPPVPCPPRSLRPMQAPHPSLRDDTRSLEQVEFRALNRRPAALHPAESRLRRVKHPALAAVLLLLATGIESAHRCSVRLAPLRAELAPASCAALVAKYPDHTIPDEYCPA